MSNTTSSTMPTMTEFYLTALWAYKPKIVKRVIDEMLESGFDDAEFIYDNQYSWFKVSCRENQEEKIRELFDSITRDIEEEAFEGHEDEILNPDDTLRSSFDNEYFSSTSSGGLDHAFADPSYCHPRSLANYSCAGIWDALDENKERGTAWNVMTARQAKQLQEMLNVKLKIRLAGKLVHIAGHSPESVRRAQEKLTVMLTAKKRQAGAEQRPTDHLVYAEHHQDRVEPGLKVKWKFKADIRYLANIEPRLASSTLLDRLAVADLAESYKTIYRQACSIRLCPWAPDKRYRISLLGPKVDDRARDKDLTLDDRPQVSFKEADMVALAEEANSSTQSNNEEVSGSVKTWIENLPEPTGSVANTPHSLLEPQAAGGSAASDTSEDLIDLSDGPAFHSEASATTTPMPGAGKPAATQADNRIPSLCRDLAGLQTESSTLRQGPTASTYTEQRRQPQTAAANQAPARSAHTPQKQKGQRGSASTGAQPSQPPQLISENEVIKKPFATEKFVEDIESAIGTLMRPVPYLRGRVSVRVEIGRAILELVDPTGMAFNAANTPSNGWDNVTLTECLNTNYGMGQNFHFTKILTTYDCDMVDLINARGAGARLWEEKSSASWITYSFHCTLRSPKNPARFIVDIDDCGGDFFYSIRLQDDGRKGRPIYVHAVCRNWDLRIAMSHVETDELERVCGGFARTLFQSLSISDNDEGGKQMTFAVKNDSIAAVNEVRVLTKWRHRSLDKKSALEITEVTQLETTEHAEGTYAGPWQSSLAQRWSQKKRQEHQSRGDFMRWYEAAVVSEEFESILKGNSALELGERAAWSSTELKARGVFPSLYAPALQMLRQMDHVGGLNNNNLSGKYGPLLLRGNNQPRYVPGQG